MQRAIEELKSYALRFVEVLGGQLDSDDERVAQTAAKDILDRVLGRATQPLEHEGAATTTIVVSSMLASVAAQLEGERGAADGELEETAG